MDKWSDWVLNKRFGNNKALFEATMSQLGKVADQIIDSAQLKEGETLLDVGTGDGLLGFRALKKVGEAGEVIFSDISADMVEHCRTLAADAGAENCRFVVNPAEDLSEIADASVDAVVCRSVLIYTNKKQEAFQEFFRVLKPGGRVSIFEPINRFSHSFGPKLGYMGYDLTPIEDIAKKVLSQFRGEAQKPEEHPMLNFDEEDMFRFADTAGFGEIRIEQRAWGSSKQKPMEFDALMNSAMNPQVPTLRDAIKNSLDAGEEEIFVNYLREQVEGNRHRSYMAIMYLTAAKS